MAPTGPYALVTVNTAPERARRIVARVTEEVKEQYTIEHVANCETIEDVERKVRQLQPDLLFCASMWTPQESARIQQIAKNVVPNIKTHAMPQGLQAEGGPDAVVKYLKERLPAILA